MKFTPLLFLLFVSCICHAQYSYVIDLKGNISTINVGDNCAVSFVTDCGIKGTTDIAVSATGLLYLCKQDSLFSLDIAAAGSPVFLGRLSRRDITGLVVGPDGNVYACGAGLTRYDPVTQTFTYIGAFPPGVISAGDMVVYNGSMFMSGIDGNIYEINSTTPSASTLFYSLNAGSLFGMLVVSTKCFNETGIKKRLIAFEPYGEGSSGYLIDMENKIAFPNYCFPSFIIAGSADLDAITVEGGPIEISSIQVQPPLCQQLDEGSITISMRPSAKNVYSFSLNDQYEQVSGMFQQLPAGYYAIRIKSQFGCYKDTFATIPASSVVCKDSLFLPSAFTPNQDGLNDVFKTKSYMPVTDFEMMIYNRNGELVFKTNSLDQGWNGTFRSVAQPTGIFVWQVRYKNATGQRRYIKGTVLLLR